MEGKIVRCEECENETAEVTGFTEDARTQIRCVACGFHWVHGPADAATRSGATGGKKHHCPVCSHIYSDPTTPIVTIGSPSKEGHRCDRTKCFTMGTTYGLNVKALDARLAELTDDRLADWPRVLEMKHERLGNP